mmetsp:Transcript_41150/g.104757  ORF Transcript_41150/g.104757 Transcript_41150/m.104757 type:complete len:260 (-) Transcript_41150:87-866(-)
MEDLKERDHRIAELEALVLEQQAEIERLSSDTAAEEVEELRSILEAQEASLEEQKEVISSQSALIDDLNSHLQTLLAAPAPSEPSRPEPSRPEPPRPSAGPSAQAGAVGGRAARPSLGGGAGSGEAPAAYAEDPRRRRPVGGPPVAMRGVSGGPASARTLREHPAMQKMVAQQSPGAEMPRPRPNSALGQSTPRSRSCTESRLLADCGSAAVDGGRRGSTRNQSPATMTAAATRGNTGYAPRKVGGACPPSLPLLRQEA